MQSARETSVSSGERWHTIESARSSSVLLVLSSYGSQELSRGLLAGCRGISLEEGSSGFPGIRRCDSFPVLGQYPSRTFFPTTLLGLFLALLRWIVCMAYTWILPGGALTCWTYVCAEGDRTHRRKLMETILWKVSNRSQAPIGWKETRKRRRNW